MKNSLSPVRGNCADTKSMHEEMNKRQEKIRVLQDEIKSFEQKNATLKAQVQHNENILNLLEEKNVENKDFLTQLQEGIESKKQITLDTGNAFIKHNFKKLKELVGDSNKNKESNEKGNLKPSGSKKSHNRSNSRFSEDKSTDIPKIEQVRMENDYMLKVISNDDTIPLPSHYKCWNDNN